MALVDWRAHRRLKNLQHFGVYSIPQLQITLGPITVRTSIEHISGEAKLNKLALSFAVVAALSSIPAGAAEPVATLLDVQGKVLINKGEGFVAATNGVALNATDKLLVGAESQAVVSYPVCSVTLAESSMFAVAKKAPCAPGENFAAIDGVLVEPATSVTCSSRNNYSSICQKAQRERKPKNPDNPFGDSLIVAYPLGIATAFYFVTFLDDDKPVSGP